MKVFIKNCLQNELILLLKIRVEFKYYIFVKSWICLVIKKNLKFYARKRRFTFFCQNFLVNWIIKQKLFFHHALDSTTLCSLDFLKWIFQWKFFAEFGYRNLVLKVFICKTLSIMSIHYLENYFVIQNFWGSWKNFFPLDFHFLGGKSNSLRVEFQLLKLYNT